ncbi:LuxR C-terminal-related transcriptional regulator [Microbacterium sp. PRC9]|uniref:helix-turn-helix transcriptional regulator n=1 Tax=Microbacterium sp. PRC9 TaxID=2962591 RepID=UPI00288219FF|nr:LuxR C-terminal-related transcriptional regulator [Microbacterium sp. PRC9]MDT0144138.1 LuxR C-terminal-related transcriptional regulator [Microbacterium sp. PRC9]
MAGVAVSPVLIGRQGEFEALRRALADGRGGVPRAMVIRGEAGIGKTRLVQEAIRALRADAAADDPPVVVATAQCVDGGDGAPPFHALRGLLRDLRAGVGDGLLDVASASPGVLRTLGVLVPELAEASVTVAPESIEPSSDLVSDTIETVVERLSERFHVVVVVEDLHWADALTASFATLLAMTLRGRHLTVVLTYRSDEVARRTMLSGVVALEGRRDIEHLELARLSGAEVGSQIEAIAPGRFSRADTDAIAARSGGVPFFVEELVSLEAEELPGPLRDLLLLRYRGTSPGARQIVALLSVGGDDVDHDILLRVSGGDRTVLDDGVREALERGLITVTATGYGFRHALLREAVYGDVLPGVRRDAHRAYADALERAGASFSTLAAVAEHRARSGDVPAAFDATVRCLAQPGSELAPSTTAALWRRLAEWWDDVPDAQDRVGGASRMEVLRRAAEYLWHAGDYLEARSVVTAALALPGPSDPVERATALWWLVMCEGWISIRADEQALAEADALLVGRTEPAALAQLARVRSISGRHDIASLEDAVSIARDSGDAETLAICLTNLAVRRVHDGDDELAAAAAHAALEVTPRAGGRHRALLVLAGIALFEARYREAAEGFEKMRREALEIGRERGHGAIATVGLAHTLIPLGRLGESEAHAQRALQLLVVPFDRSAALRVLAEGDLWGDRPTAYAEKRRVIDDEMPDVLDVPDEDYGWRRLDLLEALVRIADEPDDRRRLELVRAGVSRESALRAAETQPWVRPWSLPIRAWLVAEGRRVSGADPSLDHGISQIRDDVMALVSPPTIRGVAAVLVDFVAAESTADAAVESRLAAWRAVLAGVRAGEGLAVQFVHLAMLRLAEALVECGDRAGAEATLAELGASARAEGDALVARWAAQLAARAGLGGDPGSRIASLTERESQVLELVARGMTNPQIGRELFISPKTASIHVSSILTKLGVANRTEAAAFARARAPAAPAHD